MQQNVFKSTLLGCAIATAILGNRLTACSTSSPNQFTQASTTVSSPTAIETGNTQMDHGGMLVLPALYARFGKYLFPQGQKAFTR